MLGGGGGGGAQPHHCRGQPPPSSAGGGGCLSSIRWGRDGVYRKGAEKKPGLKAEDAAVSVAHWRVSLAF